MKIVNIINLNDTYTIYIAGKTKFFPGDHRNHYQVYVKDDNECIELIGDIVTKGKNLQVTLWEGFNNQGLNGGT